MVAPSRIGDVEGLPLLEVSSGVEGGKDGTGIGKLAAPEKIAAWAREYLQKVNTGRDIDESLILAAFQHGVQSEWSSPGQTFVEAEPSIRSEWSCVRGRLPWESVRDAVWAGFDRARNRNV